MNLLKAVFPLEVKRFLTKRNRVVFGVIIVILVYFIFDGLSGYRKTMDNRIPFQETEKKKVEKYVLTTQYGAYGIRILLLPHPASLMFNNSGLFKQLMSNVDVGERLNIYASFKDKRIFAQATGFMDFSGFLLLCCSFLGLLYGYDGFRHAVYLKYVVTLARHKAGDNRKAHKKLFRALAVSRIVLFNLAFILLILLLHLIPLAYGFNLFTKSLFHYLVLLAVISTFFISIGFLTGLHSKKIVGFLTLLAIFFCSMFPVPWIINKISCVNAESLTANYKVELQKLKTIMAAEAKILKKIGKYKSGKPATEKIKKLYRSYIDNEYKQILELEEMLKMGLSEKIKEHQLLSISVPTSFYFSCSYEFSSRGYLGLLQFYSYNQYLKDGFFKHYIYHKFDNPSEKIESYIKGDENLFFASSMVPRYFWLGVLLTLFYTALLLLWGEIRFGRVIHPPLEKSLDFSKIDIPLRTGTTAALDCDCPEFHRQIINVLGGKVAGFDGQITIDGVKITSAGIGNITYLPNHPELPDDIHAGDFVIFIKRLMGLDENRQNESIPNVSNKKMSLPLSKLTSREKMLLLLYTARYSDSSLYILHDFNCNIHCDIYDEIKEWIAEMENRGAVIVELFMGGILPASDYHAIFFREKANDYTQGRTKDYGPTPTPDQEG